MSEKPPREDLPEQDGRPLDWDSPRWRENDRVPGVEDRARRFRGDSPPVQRGAIDEGGSISGSASPEESEPTRGSPQDLEPPPR